MLEYNRQNYGGRCRARVVGVCRGIATVAHHIRGRQVTGDDPRFIEGVCDPCNLHIGDPVTHPFDCTRCVNVQWARLGPVDPKPEPFTDW